MGASIRKTLTLMLGGSSLTAGRLTTPPTPWTAYLYEDMRAAPECKGPVRIINTGKGSQTSNFGASQAALMAPLRPTHVLMEDFGINDCAIGPVSLAQATLNFNSMVASYRSANPDVVIVHQTMSPASAGDTFRTNLAAYYTNGLANAALNGLISLDNYNGTVLVPGGWVKPLPLALTVGGGSMPAGFSLFTGATWNPADKNSEITLSVDNLTATKAATPVRSMRATISAAAGKLFFQTVININANCSVGIMTSLGPLTSTVGADSQGYGYQPDGTILSGGVTVASGLLNYADGSIVMVAVDLGAHLMWVGRDGIWGNGDPAAGTGGLAITAATYFPAASLNQGASLTGAFGAPGDGLHPIWPGAFQIYSYPNILAWARSAMGAYWT